MFEYVEKEEQNEYLPLGKNSEQMTSLGDGWSRTETGLCDTL